MLPMPCAHRLRRPLVALAAGVFCSALLAAPAAWYKWTSKRDGTQVCAQVSPGEGWEKFDGPYKDAHCINEGLPGR